MNDHTEAAQSASRLLALAVTILALAMFVLSAFQVFMLVRARQNMEAARAAQETAIQDGTKLRERVEGLASGTAKLADGGDAAAKTIIENFHRQGVDIKASSK